MPPRVLLLACLAAPVVGGGCAAPPAEAVAPPPRHAVLIVVDTLRADVVEEVATPRIDELAARGASARRAWSAGTWTVPSTISILTGMSVRQHGWDLPTGDLGRYPPLPDVPTLATVLHDEGFATTGLYSNPYLDEPLGFDRGFDSWRKSADAAMARQLAAEVATSWGDGRRHFAYLHPLGPHTPLKPSAEALARWDLDPHWFEGRFGLDVGAAQRDQPPGAREAYARGYRATVEDVDALVGALVDALGPHREETLVVVTSDHGEMLGTHGFVGHGKWVWETLTRVPLVVDRPVALPDRVGGASIAALVTSTLGVDHDWPTALDTRHPLVAQREGLLALSPDGRRKGIWGPALAVFDLATDPRESTPLPDDGTIGAARATWEERVPAGRLAEATPRTPSDETVRELRALGYLEPAPTSERN